MTGQAFLSEQYTNLKNVFKQSLSSFENIQFTDFGKVLLKDLELCSWPLILMNPFPLMQKKEALSFPCEFFWRVYQCFLSGLIIGSYYHYTRLSLALDLTSEAALDNPWPWVVPIYRHG